MMSAGAKEAKAPAWKAAHRPRPGSASGASKRHVTIGPLPSATTCRWSSSPAPARSKAAPTRWRSPPRWPRWPGRRRAADLQILLRQGQPHLGLNAARGIGMDEGLAILAEVRETTGLPVLTDVHAARPVRPAPPRRWTCCRSPPSCAARPTCCWPRARPARAINVKKGQFLAPWDMTNVAAKIASTGNDSILLCERGASFGYNTLVTDMRALPIMARDRLSGGVRRDPCGAAAGRAGHQFRRPARIRAGAGARRGRGRRGRGVHRDASGSRQRALATART